MANDATGVALVVDLNKCVGCQACAVACKVWWTSKEKGAEHAWWLITETRPGSGYPKNWIEKSRRGERQSPEDYEPENVFRYENLINNPTDEIPPKITPDPAPSWGPNWEWDQGDGETPEDAWFFYMPIQCMHCEDAPCEESCPTHAIYRREEDGIVMTDPQLCMSCQSCFEACPYRRVFWNHYSGNPSKCILCQPLVEKGDTPICVKACTARARFFGRLEDTGSSVYVLIKESGVAIPLFPQFNTKPRIRYIPPVMLPPKPDGNPRYDEKYLEDLFGKDVWKVRDVLESEIKKGAESRLIRVLTGYTLEKNKRW